jgi:hypothetical protein
LFLESLNFGWGFFNGKLSAIKWMSRDGANNSSYNAPLNITMTGLTGILLQYMPNEPQPPPALSLPRMAGMRTGSHMTRTAISKRFTGTPLHRAQADTAPSIT